MSRRPHWDDDLISTDAYDTLTRPWGEVIGPIHPDDPDMRRGA